jgi:hypothetical protein
MKGSLIETKIMNKMFVELAVHFFKEDRIICQINMIINNMVITIQLNNFTLVVQIQKIIILLIINLKVDQVISNNKDFLNYLVIKVSFSPEDSVLMKIHKKK